MVLEKNEMILIRNKDMEENLKICSDQNKLWFFAKECEQICVFVDIECYDIEYLAA